MNFKKFMGQILLVWLYILNCYAGDFKVVPISAEDKKIISTLLQKYETKWVSEIELKKYPGLYWQEELQKQSFKITSTQIGMEDVYFVPIQADFENGIKSKKGWGQSLSILIINRSDLSIVKMPDHPVLEWSFDHIEAVSFKDLQGKGKRAILVNATGITGVGPTGTVPFDVIAVYLPDEDGSWRLDSNLQEKISEQILKNCRKSSCRDLKTVSKMAEAFLKNK